MRFLLKNDLPIVTSLIFVTIFIVVSRSRNFEYSKKKIRKIYLNRVNFVLIFVVAYSFFYFSVDHGQVVGQLEALEVRIPNISLF